MGEPDLSAANQLVVRRACDELSRRLRSGRPCEAEEFLAAHPSIRSDSDAVLELLYTEFIVREQRGERPRPRDWLERFPQWSAELSELFEIHTLVEQDAAARHNASGIDEASTTAIADDNTLRAHGDQFPVLAGYEILEEIGRGGMGVVYQARHRGLGRVVAIKMLLSPNGTRERARFRAEAEATARLSHPNIVQIFEVGDDGDHPFLAMEYVAGKSLDQRLTASALLCESAAKLLLELAGAVSYAHDQGIIHRDLKPANIVLAADGTPKITDFGLARQLAPPGATSDARTDGPPSVAIVGTPGYMAPEQCAAGSQVSPAVDVYSLGAILYESLTGRPPFLGQSALDILELVRSQEPVPPSRLASKLPRDLETICLKCLAKQPHQRYSSAAALADDLRRFLMGETILARPVARTERALRWCKRNPTIAALAGGIMLALLCGIAASTSLAVWALREKSRADQHAAQVLGARELAERHFTQAERAVEEYLDGVEENDRLKEADFLDLRKQLLMSAVPFYEDFVRARPGDTALDAKRGRAYERLASVHSHLGDRVQASTDYRQALVIFRTLAHEQPSIPEYRQQQARSHHGLARMLFDLGSQQQAEIELREALALQKTLAASFHTHPGYRSDLAASHHALGYMLRGMGNARVAENEYNQAIALRQALAAEYPSVARYRAELADSHTGLGTVLEVLGRRAEEVSEYRKVLPIQHRLAVEFPNLPDYRQSLARTHTNLGVLLSQVRQPAEAEVEYREALRLQRNLAADFPNMPEYRRSIALILVNIASLRTGTGSSADGRAELREAQELQTRLVEQFPNVIDYRSQLGKTLRSLAIAEYRTGEFEKARRLLGPAIEHQKKARRAAPDNPTYRDLLRDAYRALAHTNLRLKDHAKTAEVAGWLAQDRPDEADAAYRAAWALSHCVELAEHDSTISATRRADLAQSYADQAVGYLREAKRRGFSNFELLNKTRAFGPIRRRPDFQLLVQELARR